MPLFLENLEHACPGLWANFCAQAEDDAWQWTAKLNGTAPCLDRDWRKLVFKVFDFLVTSRGLVKRPYRPSGRRLETIVHPVSASD